MNNIAYFEIQSSNPARDAQFYQAVFGWQFKLDESLPIEYYRIETPSIMGGLLKRPLKHLNGIWHQCIYLFGSGGKLR